MSFLRVKTAALSEPAVPVRRRLVEGGSPPKGFTIVEVMMASVILVVGFIGMIQGITIGSEMLATARRQTLAAQIINHETEKLRLTAWASLPAAASNVAVTIDSQFDTAITACGLVKGTTITLARTTTDIDTDSDTVTDLKEVTFTVIWNKSGTNTAATTATGSWLNQLSFASPSPIARTYTRTATAYFGKYGLNLAYQRS
jgi:prepilin-type N-terminal cleavage/methylation domain-containing protein